MKIVAGVISHPGKCREKNEDNYCFNSMMPDEVNAFRSEGGARPPQHGALFGVFDGMGGASMVNCRLASDSSLFRPSVTGAKAFDTGWAVGVGVPILISGRLSSCSSAFFTV